MSKGAGADTDKWVLYFKGGGWCYNEQTCAQRATSLSDTTLTSPS